MYNHDCQLKLIGSGKLLGLYTTINNTHNIIQPIIIITCTHVQGKTNQIS